MNKILRFINEYGRFILIYGLEILSAAVGAFALCVFIMYPEPWKLVVVGVAVWLSVLIDYRNDGWIKRERYKTYDYQRNDD